MKFGNVIEKFKLENVSETEGNFIDYYLLGW